MVKHGCQPASLKMRDSKNGFCAFALKNSMSAPETLERQFEGSKIFNASPAGQKLDTNEIISIFSGISHNYWQSHLKFIYMYNMLYVYG